jgi:hypothetical protein
MPAHPRKFAALKRVLSVTATQNEMEKTPLYMRLANA